MPAISAVDTTTSATATANTSACLCRARPRTRYPLTLEVYRSSSNSSQAGWIWCISRHGTTLAHSANVYGRRYACVQALRNFVSQIEAGKWKWQGAKA